MLLFIDDIFKDYGAEELLLEIIKNNYGILCKLPDPISKLSKRNIINAILHQILGRNSQKDETYWHNMLKIFQLL